MTGKDNRPGNAAELRKHAEEIARGKVTPIPENIEALSPEKTRQLVHELQVHQIELEMQNEELRRAQEKLEVSRAQYFDLYDLAPVGYFTLSETGLIMEANLTAAALLGVARSALINRPLTHFILPEDQDIYYRHRKLLFETGAPQICEIRIGRADAAPCWVRIDAVAAQETDGAPTCRATMIDITERKRGEAALQKSEEKFRNYIERAPDGVLIADNTGRYLEANTSVCRIIGYSMEEIEKMTIQDLLAEESLEDGLAHFKKLMETGVATSDLWHKHKDGSKRCLTVNAVKLSETRVLGFCKDITERKEAEKTLKETLASLRKAFGATVHALVSAVESRDPYTAGHQIRSAGLARAIAQEMGLPQERIDGLSMAGSIHDIGKLSVPAEILSKPTKLSELEFAIVKEHAQKGFEMLKYVESPWPLAEIVHQHHERMDGSGYPRRIKGKEILMEARILAVADVVESMASYRPYRPAIGIDAALEEIENNKGTLFETDAVDACLRLFREKGFQFEKN